jgi:Arc/MetJ family transcription regulator
VYSRGVTRRTNLNLDMDLVREAGTILGTTQITATVHAALREIVARERRRELVAHEFPGLDPESLEALRRPPGRAA